MRPIGEVTTCAAELRFSLAMLAMAPLGAARAADLVVWWDEGLLRGGGRGGQGDRRRLRAGHRQAGRARLLSAGRSFRPRSRRRWRPASRPTSPSATCSSTTSASGPFDDRLVDLSDAVGHFSDLFDPDVLACVTWRNASTGQKALYGLPIGRTTTHLHVWKSLLGARGLHARGHPEGVGGVLVVLVRRGAASRAQGHGARRHLGRRPAHVGRVGHPRTSSSSSWLPTRRTT